MDALTLTPLRGAPYSLIYFLYLIDFIHFINKFGRIVCISGIQEKIRNKKLLIISFMGQCDLPEEHESPSLVR